MTRELADPFRRNGSDAVWTVLRVLGGADLSEVWRFMSLAIVEPTRGWNQRFWCRKCIIWNRKLGVRNSKKVLPQATQLSHKSRCVLSKYSLMIFRGLPFSFEQFVNRWAIALVCVSRSRSEVKLAKLWTFTSSESFLDKEAGEVVQYDRLRQLRYSLLYRIAMSSLSTLLSFRNTFIFPKQPKLSALWSSDPTISRKGKRRFQT